MNLTIRRARESDRKVFDWQPYRVAAGVNGRRKPWVVTVDGEPFVAFGPNREIVWQNGTESVAPLVRVAVRYFDSMQQVHYDLADVRLERRSAATRQRLHDAMRRAGV